MIGYVGTLLGKDKVNIANMSLSRQEPGQTALMVINLDSEPSDAARARNEGPQGDQAREVRPAVKPAWPSPVELEATRSCRSPVAAAGRLPAGLAAVRLPRGPLAGGEHLRGRAAAAPARPTSAGCWATGPGNAVLVLDMLKGAVAAGWPLACSTCPGRQPAEIIRPPWPMRSSWLRRAWRSPSSATPFPASPASGRQGRRDRRRRASLSCMPLVPASRPRSGSSSSTPPAMSPWPRSCRGPDACPCLAFVFRRGRLALAAYRASSRSLSSCATGPTSGAC